jgi:hypothetical protein
MSSKREPQKNQPAKDTRFPRWEIWPENPSKRILLSLVSWLFRVGVLSSDIVFVLHLMSLDPIPPLSTDCPEVIGLVNHSATALVITKALILI